MLTRARSCGCRKAVALLLVLGSIPSSVSGQQPRHNGVPVFGVVRDALGKPVEGVEVRAMGFVARGLPALLVERLKIGLRVAGSARTDARGRFVVRVRSASRFGIVAVQRATARSAVAAPVSPGSQLELRLRPVRIVRGRIIDLRDGGEHPVPGRRVRSFGPVVSRVANRPEPDLSLGLIEEVTTDAKGGFEITVFRDAECRVSDVEGGMSAIVGGKAQPEEPLLLKRYSRSVAITMVDSKTSTPVPGGRVHVGGESFRADAKGLCVVRVPRGSQVDIEADGYALKRMKMVLTEKRTVELRRAGRVRVRLVEAGKPGREREVLVLRVAYHSSGSGYSVVRMRTDRAGRLVVNRPRRDGIAIWVKRGTHYVRVCDVAGGDGDVDREDVSMATFELRGTVFGVDGVPAAHVPVHTGPTDHAFGLRLSLSREPATYTDHAGRFSIQGLGHQLHDIAAISARSLPAFSLAIAPIQKKPIELRLRRAPLLRGRVVDNGGKPVADVLVVASPTPIAMKAEIRRFGFYSIATRTNPAGEYVLPAIVPDVTHRLQAMAPSGYVRPARLEAIPPVKDVDITLTRSK